MTPLQGRTAIPAPDSRQSYELVKELEQRLGRSANPDYDLGLTLTVTENRLAVTSDNVTTRFDVVGDLDYSLTDLVSGDVMGSGTVTSYTGYSATGSTVATEAAQSDAHDRLMVILTDMLISRLTADLARGA